jgi:hypothetical protein
MAIPELVMAPTRIHGKTGVSHGNPKVSHGSIVNSWQIESYSWQSPS